MNALRPVRVTSWQSFRALLLRDLAVLDKSLGQFLARTITQPLLFVFVLTYVLPKIAVGGAASGPAAVRFTTVLVGGVVTLSVFLQAILSVALPLVSELGITGEIEDRMLAPMSASMVAAEKIVAAAIQGLFAGVVVFPIAAVVPLTPVELDVNWPVLLTIVPLACVTSAAAGLALGTLFDFRMIGVMYSIVLLPVTFLGGVFFSWTRLDPIPWLKYAVLVNPLVYMSEGMRAALSSGLPHMSLPAVYGALTTSAVLLSVLAVRGFTRRVVL